MREKEHFSAILYGQIKDRRGIEEEARADVKKELLMQSKSIKTIRTIVGITILSLPACFVIYTMFQASRDMEKHNAEERAVMIRAQKAGVEMPTASGDYSNVGPNHPAPHRTHTTK